MQSKPIKRMDISPDLVSRLTKNHLLVDKKSHNINGLRNIEGKFVYLYMYGL